MFQNRLAKVNKHFSKIARKSGITCFRIYDLDLPEFPFAIDKYDDAVYIAEYRRNHNLSPTEHIDWLNKSMAVISITLETDAKLLFLKERKIIENRSEQYVKNEAEKHERIVHEGGLQFIVNLGEYLDTGLFPDHRITRSMVKEMCNGKSVLNLFAYTGAFSVYAAAGGAAKVETIDLSKTYIDWAKKNMQLNGFDDIEKYTYLQADVLKILPQLRKGSYDIIVLDPPTFSNSKRMDGVLDTQRQHVEMINYCLHALKVDGTLIFSTNYTKFHLDVELISGLVKDITKQTIPFDYQKMQRYCFKITHKPST